MTKTHRDIDNNIKNSIAEKGITQTAKSTHSVLSEETKVSRLHIIAQNHATHITWRFSQWL